MDIPERLRNALFGSIIDGLPYFCLERWQSLHENTASIVLSESGVHPLSLLELEEYGVDIHSIHRQEIGYGWTRGSPELRERIAELYGGAAEAEDIVVTNGSAEANFITILATISRGDTVVVDVPNYMQVPGLLKWIEAKTIYLWREPPHWKFPVGKAVELIERYRPRAIFVTDPNNPTGSYMSRGELRELADAANRAGTLLVFDEVYWGSERGEAKDSVVQIVEEGNAVSISGLSKVYGLPGLRVGWVAVKSERIVERLLGVKDYTSIAPSILSDYIASKILSWSNVEKLRRRAKELVERNIEILKKELSNRGGIMEIYWPSAGAFIWAKIPWTLDSLKLAYELFTKYRVLVNPGECFELKGYLRMGIGQKPELFGKSIKFVLSSIEEIQKHYNEG
ncbi:MAG: pyridoxal phosphate-dependent aminotransferase [Ignisphaera sp.]|nr:pyridoxal phosphate-dependent aminotransferase [Ignisphaera sp.]MCX8167680.1 pyridoxal phosphate-dependent aminotransferase [Ignisphaera sp.]MDW8085670.1 pyridoxal phosphate-dependent aminotransferase [Ignisphaera sp.]